MTSPFSSIPCTATAHETVGAVSSSIEAHRSSYYARTSLLDLTGMFQIDETAEVQLPVNGNLVLEKLTCCGKVLALANMSRYIFCVVIGYNHKMLRKTCQLAHWCSGVAIYSVRWRRLAYMLGDDRQIVSKLCGSALHITRGLPTIVDLSSKRPNLRDSGYRRVQATPTRISNILLDLGLHATQSPVQRIVNIPRAQSGVWRAAGVITER
ncbi:hypothetical protein F4677DRAFT_200193 [Hypoxylon crocopeplum]|nr:hypothetical protein F4677DRAFT_200193 [Hypoxylon crocopeplum]